MMKLPENLQIVLVLAVSFHRFPCIDAVNSYLSYQNAVCTDSSSIAGTMVMSYDDAYWNNFQMSLDYEGECGYYTNGYLDVDNWDYSDDALGTGYCVTCNGNVGCSSDGTCDNFMTYPAEVSSESGYQMTSTSTTSTSSNQVAETPAMTLTLQAQKSTIQAMSSRAGQQHSATTASLFGSSAPIVIASFAGVVASLALVVSAIRNRRIQRASTAESPPSTELPYYLSRD